MKKLLSVLLATVLLLTCVPLCAVSVSANEIAPESDFLYEIEDGEATIIDYLGDGGDVIIPISLGGCPVTEIGEYAFYWYTNLTSVTIGNGVTSIGDYAFYCCTNLTSVTIPDSVTTIGHDAFSDCAAFVDVAQDNPNYCSLDGVLFNKDKSTLIAYPGGKSGAYTIPDSVTSIGNHAFFYCDSLTSVTIPDSVTTIGYGAFHYCLSLTSVTIPDNVTSIGDYAFSDCDSLTSVTIPDSVTTIGDYAFRFCSSLTSVTIPDSVTTIGDYAFRFCSSLTSVTIPDGITTIGYGAFSYCTSLADVYYTGNENSRSKITIDTGNSELLNATWHYNSCKGNAKHTYKSATCTKAKTCKVCGVTSGKKLGHTYTNSCDKSCNRCKATRTIKHKYTNSCDTSCNTCKATRKITHKYETVTKMATTTANGYTVKRCSVCKKETGKTTIYKANKVTLSKTTYTYNGKAQKPTVTVKDAKGNKIASSNYTVTYASGRKNVGTYKVTIKFKGKYSGTKTLTFKINPVKTTVSKLTAAKKSLKVTITKKTTQVTGYEVQYATNKNFTSAKTKTLTSYKKNTLTLSGLTAKKTYYVRVRTYKTVNGKKVYSAWSAVKSMKTK